MINLPNFKKSKTIEAPKDETFLGVLLNDFDISVFLYSKTTGQEKPTIIFEKTILFDFELTSQKICEEQVIEKIRKILTGMYELHNIQNRDVVIAIGEKFIKSTTTTVRLKREKQEEKITESEIEDITQKIVNKVKNDFELEHANTQFELLNYNLTHSKIDGYLTRNLVNMRGSTLDVSLFSAFCKTDTIKEITDFCRLLKLKLITITSHLYILEKLLRNIEYENYSIILIKDGTSDLGIVFGEDLAYTMSIKMGYFTFLNFLRETSNLSFEEIQQFLSKEIINEKLTESSREINTIYSANLVKNLQKNDKINTYPSTIIIVSKDSEILDLNLLKETYKQLNLNAEPNIVKIENHNLEYVENYSDIKNEYLALSVALCMFYFEIKNI
ncbi:hypothetical protein KA001_00640 [Patescibacteria group bacterium]|nr:hypothetical protein [Patescibacteria group bacterium]